MAKSRIRFGLDLIPASIIAGQWFCEKAVDLSLRNPSLGIPSLEMDMGTFGHEIATSKAEALAEPEVKRLIKSGKKQSLSEAPFRGTFHGITIKGYPDYVEFKQGKALLLLDYKFSKHKRIFPSQRIQVDTYGYLLNKNHLDTNRLICGILIISPDLAGIDPADFVTREAKEIASDMRRKKFERVDLQGDPVYGELYAFSLSTAEKNLSWAMDYWTEKRTPKPTTKAYKCAACSFSAAGKCRAALATPKRTRR